MGQIELSRTDRHTISSAVAGDVPANAPPGSASFRAETARLEPSFKISLRRWD
jgi:hypothetical protein